MEMDNMFMEMDNMFRTLLFDPSNETREFRCDICNKYLSIAPILFHKTVGKVCGRCFEIGETKKFPDVTFESQPVYERIAKYIIFPCSFQSKGCEEKLDWTQVSHHEASCLFRDIKCPFGADDLLLEDIIKCQWKGDNQNLFGHLMYRHGAYFNDSLKISIPASDQPDDSIIISQFMNIPVVAILYVSDDSRHIFFHLLMDTSFVQCEGHTYDLEVTDRFEKHKLVFPENKVAQLCDGAFTANSLEHGLDMDLAGLESFLRSNYFKFWFKIKSKKSDPLKEESDLPSVEDNIFDAKCMSCGNILFHPILLCGNGHNICHDCTSTKINCECGAEISKNRNEVLENLSKMSLHSCKNRDQGCSKLLKSNQLEFHLKNCELTAKGCEMASCTWSGNNRDMLKHVKNEHFLIELNQAHLIDFQKECQCDFVLFDGKIFVLTIKIHKSSLSLKVQCLGDQTCKYRFEFAIMSGKLKLTCCHYCAPLLYGSDEEDYYVNYPVDMLSQFLSEGAEACFKLNIFH